MTDTNNARITRIELEKLLSFVKQEIESKMSNLTGLVLSKLGVLLQITFATDSGALSKNNTQEKSATISTGPSEVFIIMIILGIWIYAIGRYWKPILIYYIWRSIFSEYILSGGTFSIFLLTNNQVSISDCSGQLGLRKERVLMVAVFKEGLDPVGICQWSVMLFDCHLN